MQIFQGKYSKAENEHAVGESVAADKKHTAMTTTGAAALPKHQDKKDKTHRPTVGGLTLHDQTSPKKLRKKAANRQGKKQIKSIEVNEANILPSRVRTRNAKSRKESAVRVDWGNR